MYWELININNPLSIGFITLGAFWFIQMIYYWFIFGKFAFQKYRKEEIAEKKPISVVISARDEFSNLEKNLKYILEQDYPEYEVVVVNHCSSDDTEFLLKEYSQRYDHLKVVTVSEDLNFFSGKKFALSLGIKSAKYDYLILTDADCKPKSNEWISYMQRGFSENSHITLGYGGYAKTGGFLNTLIRFDTVFIALQYFSFAMLKIPYMGVGRNLAYRKGLFIKSKGFTAHYNINSGDDDLFINRIANCKNTSIEFDPRSHTISEPKKSAGEWFRQKKRHLSTGKHYKFRHKFLLGLLSFSRFGFYASLITLLSFNFFIEIIAGLYALRLFTQLIVIKKTMNKLEERNLLLISPLLDLVFVFINTGLILSNLVFKTNKWK